MSEWWRKREHGIVAIASLVTLAMAIVFVVWRFDLNDRQLDRTHCESQARLALSAVSTWTRITNAIPGETEVEQNILDYIIICNPIPNCEISVEIPSPPDECFTVDTTTPTTSG